jgi:hypothetical protein
MLPTPPAIIAMVAVSSGVMPLYGCRPKSSGTSTPGTHTSAEAIAMT